MKLKYKHPLKTFIFVLNIITQTLSAQHTEPHNDTWHCGTSDTPQYQAIPTASLDARNECGVMRDTLYSTMIWHPRVPLETNFAREVKKFIIEQGDPFLTKCFTQIKSPRGKPIVIKTKHIEMDTAIASLLERLVLAFPFNSDPNSSFLVFLAGVIHKDTSGNMPSWFPKKDRIQLAQYIIDISKEFGGDFHEFVFPENMHPRVMANAAGVAANIGEIRNGQALDKSGVAVYTLGRFLVEPTDPNHVREVGIIRSMIRAHEMGHLLSLPHAYLLSSQQYKIHNIMDDKGGNKRLSLFTEKRTITYNDIPYNCLDIGILFKYAGTLQLDIDAKWWNEGEEPHVDMIHKFLPYFMANNKQRCTTKSDDRMEDNINVFPNPVSNNTLTISKPLENNALDIVISNTMGQIVIRKTMSAHDTALDINLPPLINGLYFIHIQDTKTLKRAVKKVVVQH